MFATIFYYTKLTAVNRKDSVWKDLIIHTKFAVHPPPPSMGLKYGWNRKGEGAEVYLIVIK